MKDIVETFYQYLLRPVLFRLPAETAMHTVEHIVKNDLVFRHVIPGMNVHDDRLKVSLSGIPLQNPVGLAAGYDKNCEMVRPLYHLGYGYLVVGTVIKDPRPGNPRPRLFRYVKEQSLINAMGFPSKGLEYAARRLEKARTSTDNRPIITSIAGPTIEEVVECHRRLEPLSDAIEINISCPNTQDQRIFHEPQVLARLVKTINEVRSKPLFIKLPPYPENDASERSTMRSRGEVLPLVETCMREGADGLTIANSRPSKDPRLSVGSGGLTGKLLFSDTIRMVADIRKAVGRKPVINASGGIFTGADVFIALKAGATSVQVYSAMVYRGPGVVKAINLELLKHMESEGIRSLKEMSY